MWLIFLQFFPVMVLSFLEAGFQSGFGCLVNKTWIGGGKRHGPCPSGLFVFSVPPLFHGRTWAGLWPGMWTLHLCFMPGSLVWCSWELTWRWSSCAPHRSCHLYGTWATVFLWKERMEGACSQWIERALWRDATKSSIAAQNMLLFTHRKCFV